MILDGPLRKTKYYAVRIEFQEIFKYFYGFPIPQIWKMKLFT